MSDNTTTITTTTTSTQSVDKPIDVADIQSQSLTTTPILGGILEDDQGGTSSMRVFMLVGGGFILLIWGFVVIWGVLHGSPPADIPVQWSLAFASLIAGKVSQKYFENK